VIYNLAIFLISTPFPVSLTPFLFSFEFFGNAGWPAFLNFIFIIFKFLILRDKKESCYISATKKMILDVNEFY
jgi:hypothetical protein